MTGWIILSIYLVGFVACARIVAHRLISNDDKDHRPADTEDRIMARVMGCLVALGWPALLVGAAVTGRLPKTDRQLRDELRERERRIAELERELGVGEQS